MDNTFFLKPQNYVLILAFAILIFGEVEAKAQTVSLMVGSMNTSDSILMEVEMKKLLRAEGLEVKGNVSDEGFFVFVDLMKLKYESGAPAGGYAGYLIIGSPAWSNIADSALDATCNVKLVKKIKTYLGVDMVFIDGNMAVSSSIESLAYLLSTYANRVIQTKSKEITTLMAELRKELRRRMLWKIA